jgi:hypothetical protein
MAVKTFAALDNESYHKDTDGDIGANPVETCEEEGVEVAVEAVKTVDAVEGVDTVETVDAVIEDVECVERSRTGPPEPRERSKSRLRERS